MIPLFSRFPVMFQNLLLMQPLKRENRRMWDDDEEREAALDALEKAMLPAMLAGGNSALHAASG
jgi:hypothetical protein